MADNTTLDAGAGGDTIATDDIAGVKHQLVKVEYGAPDSATPVSTSNPLPVDVTNASVADGGTLPGKGVQVGGTDGSVFQVMSTDSAGRPNVNVNGTVPVSGPLTDTQLRATPVPVSGTVTASGPLTDTQLRATPVPVSGTVTANGAVTNAGTFAVQDSQKVADNAAFTDGTTPVQPAGYVFDEVAGTSLTENDAAAARIDAKRAQVLVLEDATTRGQRAAVSAGGAVKVDGSAVTQPVSGTVTATGPLTDTQLRATPVPVSGTVTANLAAGTNNIGDVDVLTLPSIPAGTNNIGDVDVLTLPTLPAGTNAIGKLAANSGVDIGDVDVTSLPALAAGTNLIGRVQLDPQTANGLTTFHLVSANTTNATNLKASAGQVFGWYIYNSNAAARKVAFHNTAGTPTAGASVHSSIVIPPTSAANVFSDIGITFGTGIAITTVTDLTDAGTTAVALNDLVINIYWK